MVVASSQVTGHTTWSAPDKARAEVYANDFNIDLDSPQLDRMVHYQDRYLTDGPNASPDRDWCNPNLCWNDRPCSNGQCDCGQEFTGERCEFLSEYGRQVRALKAEQANADALEAAERERDENEARWRKLRDLQARNMTTESGGPGTALHAIAVETLRPSVLMPWFKRARDLPGPPADLGSTAPTHEQAQQAMDFYGDQQARNALVQDKETMRKARRLAALARKQSAQARIQAATAEILKVPADLKSKYPAPPTAAPAAAAANKN